jgi:DNA-binding LacI/PurR family transcriptional regulator
VETPVVLIGERTVPARFDHVLMDNVTGARMATRLLIKRGARRIALLGGATGDGDSMPQLRTRGYLAAHRAARLAIRPELIRPGGFRRLDGFEQVRRLIEEEIAFDAVFALTDTGAMGALTALVEAGLRVPDDVQVIGFDNLSDTRFSVPPLSTVEPGNDRMADAICELLLSRMEEDGERRPAQVVMPAARLVERGTTRAG